MKTARRLGSGAALCVGLGGCAVLPLAALNLAAQGAQGLVALALGPMAAAEERAETDRCMVYANKGISVTESLETRIPRDEGAVGTFEPASWRPEFAREGYPQTERSRTPTEGTFAITERSVLLVPAPGATMVRIPYELVQGVEIERDAVTGESRSMIVRSCSGRFDIVTFGKREPGSTDKDTTAAATAELEARMAAFRAATGESASLPR